MNISVIIPTLNEAEVIGELIIFIVSNSNGFVGEVIVVDGNSADNTIEIAAQAGAKVLLSNKRSRAAQMNKGAQESIFDLLYFVHADVKLDKEFAKDIMEAIESGYDAGCYRYQFDSPRRILKVNAYFTRFNRIMCRGGDQTLFIRKNIFNSLRGFNEGYVIMEDYDLIQRIQKKFNFYIIPKNILVSARKYETNSWIRVQCANLTVFIMYFLRRPPEKMAWWYKRILDYRQ